MNAPIFTHDAEDRAPGSARFQRVGFGILPKRTFCPAWSDWTCLPYSTRQEVREGGTPSPTLGTSALPGTSAAPLIPALAPAA